MMKGGESILLLISLLVIVFLILVTGQTSMFAVTSIIGGLVFLAWLAFPTRYTGAVAPIWVVLLTLGAVPVLMVVVVALFQVDSSNMLSGDWSFVGLKNLRWHFADGDDDYILVRTFIFASVAVALQFSLGIPWGLMLARRGRFSWIDALLIVPVTMPPIITALVMRAAFDPGFGVVNELIAAFGQTPPDWFAISLRGDQEALLPTALVPSLIAETWQWTPFVALTVALSLRRLSPVLMDWACATSGFLSHRLRLVVLPQVGPVLVLVAAFRYLDSVKIFESVWVPFGEGILTATAAVRITTYGLQIRDYSAAAALSLFMLMVVGTAAMVATRALLRLWENRR